MKAKQITWAYDEDNKTTIGAIDKQTGWIDDHIVVATIVEDRANAEHNYTLNLHIGNKSALLYTIEEGKKIAQDYMDTTVRQLAATEEPVSLNAYELQRFRKRVTYLQSNLQTSIELLESIKNPMELDAFDDIWNPIEAALQTTKQIIKKLPK